MSDMNEIYLRDIYHELKRIRMALEKIVCEPSAANDGGKTWQTVGARMAPTETAPGAKEK